MPAKVLFLNPMAASQPPPHLTSLVVRGDELLGLGGDDREETWRSRDGGATWAFRRSFMQPGKHDLVTLAPDGRLLATSSVGARWSRSPGLPRWTWLERDGGSLWWSLAVDDEGVLWRAGQLSWSAERGVLAHASDGATWARVAPPAGEYFPFAVNQIVCRQGKVYALHGKALSVCTRAGTERSWLPNIGSLRSLAFSPSGAMLLVGDTGARVAASPADTFRQIRIPGPAWGFRQGAWVDGLGFVLTSVTGVYVSADGKDWRAARELSSALDEARGKKGPAAFGAVAPLAAGRALVGTLEGDLLTLEA